MKELSFKENKPQRLAVGVKVLFQSYCEESHSDRRVGNIRSKTPHTTKMFTLNVNYWQGRDVIELGL